MTFHWDKLLNFTTGLGIPGADKGASAEYSLVLLQPDQLEAAYRSDVDPDDDGGAAALMSAGL